jgi:hypothetical protein
MNESFGNVLIYMLFIFSLPFPAPYIDDIFQRPSREELAEHTEHLTYINSLIQQEGLPYRIDIKRSHKHYTGNFITMYLNKTNDADIKKEEIDRIFTLLPDTERFRKNRK